MAPIASMYDWNAYGPTYYLNGALCGGLCCSVTHGGLCPVDVVKTRIQLDPVTYNRGLIGGFRQVVAAEGAGALATGLGPTAIGYFIQGWFKFGGFEFFKINAAKALGDQKAYDYRTGIYLGSSACAEFIADIFLCPLEAARIRQVSDPAFAKQVSGTVAAVRKLFEMEGFAGWYSGFVPILFKQVPYTMAKFAVQGAAAESMYDMLPDRKTLGTGTKMLVSLGSGTIAGVCAAIISHPADTLLSKINKKGAGGEGGMVTRLGRIAGEIGFVKLCTTGLGPRCVMIGTLTAGQFFIFDSLMPVMGVEKFHFHNPASHH
jgi:solute carrier family 25 phosphate transporter 3